MSDFRNAWAIDNLKLAWQRVRSNPDRAYKSYFRNQYAAYALADDAQLRHLQNRLSRGIFEPTDACKIYFPKPSGILRPYSLLSVEDQIVYQAIAKDRESLLATVHSVKVCQPPGAKCQTALIPFASHRD